MRVPGDDGEAHHWSRTLGACWLRGCCRSVGCRGLAGGCSGGGRAHALPHRRSSLPSCCSSLCAGLRGLSLCLCLCLGGWCWRSAGLVKSLHSSGSEVGGSVTGQKQAGQQLAQILCR